MSSQNAWEFHGLTEHEWYALSASERVHYQSNRKAHPMTEKQWVVVPGIAGWVREHDPETESGLAPIGKYRAEESTTHGG